MAATLATLGMKCAVTLEDFLPEIRKMAIWEGVDMSNVPVTIRHRPNHRCSSGWASWGGKDPNRVAITISAGTSISSQVATAIHEFCHIWFFKTGKAMMKKSDEINGHTMLGPKHPDWLEGKSHLDENHGPRFQVREQAGYSEWLGEKVVVTQADLNVWRAKRGYHRYAACTAMTRMLDAKGSPNKA